MSSAILSAMEKEPVQMVLSVKDAVKRTSVEKPKLSMPNDGFVDLNDWSAANPSPTGSLHSRQGKKGSSVDRAADADEPLVGNSWLTLKKNLEKKINNKRQQSLNCRYELWKEDQEQSAMMEEKLLYAFVEEDESAKRHLDDSFSEDDTNDGQEASETSDAPIETELLPKLNQRIDAGSDSELDDPSADYKQSVKPDPGTRLLSTDGNDSDDEQGVSLNFAPRAMLSSDDDYDDSNCNAHACPTLNVRSDAPAVKPKEDSQPEAELSISDLFVKPSDSSSDLAMANLFFDDSKQEDSFSLNTSGYNDIHLSHGVGSSPLRGNVLPEKRGHRETLVNFQIPQGQSSVDLNSNTESSSLEKYCSGEFPDSRDRVDASSRSKSRSSLTFDRFDTNDTSSPIRQSKKRYHGLFLDNDSAEETDDLELLCSAPFASSPMASKPLSSYPLEAVLDENARDGYPKSKPVGNVAETNPDLLDTEDDSDESLADIGVPANKAASSSLKHHQSVQQLRQDYLRSDFLDVEAELSGSDDSGDEEEVDAEDEYEDDFIDSTEDLKSDRELRAEIGKIHTKQLIEEDARMINLFKEKLLDSREVRTGLRQRRMGWATARDDPQDKESKEDNEDETELLVEDSLSRWQMARRDKAEWLLAKGDPLHSDDSETESNNTASMIFEYGMQARSGTNSNSRQLSKMSMVTKVVQDGSIALTANRIESHFSESLLRREQTRLEQAFKCASESSDFKNNAFVPLPISDEVEERQSQSESIPLQKRRRLAAEQSCETVFRHMR